MTFDPAYLVSVLPALLRGATVNLWLAAAISVLAMLGGTGLMLVRVQKIRFINRLIDIMISFVRGTPLLVQIFIVYYVFPVIGIDLSPQMAGVVAIAANSSVFITETMRSGLQAMDPGQIEAAVALSLDRSTVWCKILLPQLFRRILPVLVSELTIIIKGTALLSVITVVEVMRTAQQISSASYRPFETMTAAALIFLVMNLAVIAVGSAAETRLSVRAA